MAYTLCHQPVVDPFLKGLQRALQHPGIVKDADLQQILEHKTRCKDEMRTLGSRFTFTQRPIPMYVLEYCALDVVFLFSMYAQWAPMCKGVDSRTNERIRAYVEAPQQRPGRFMARVDFSVRDEAQRPPQRGVCPT